MGSSNAVREAPVTASTPVAPAATASTSTPSDGQNTDPNDTRRAGAASSAAVGGGVAGGGAEPRSIAIGSPLRRAHGVPRPFPKARQSVS